MPEPKWAAATTGSLRWVAAAAAVVSLSVAAHAGGYDTGERDWDFLFQQDKFAAEAATRYIDPQRTLTSVTGVGAAYGGANPTASNVGETEAFTVERYSVAGRLAPNFRCMGSYRQPFEGHANYGSWFASASATEQHFTSEDYGATCALSAAAGMGDLLFIGGASYQTIHYQLVQDYGPGGKGTTDVGDDGVGWRAGIGYEITQYAMRATLIYNSAIAYDMTGTGTNLATGGTPYNGALEGSITMPQSVALKVQSGIAPGWLAFGGITWTDWGVDQDMGLCAPGTPSCMTGVNALSALTLLFKDTWTVTVGAAHPFNEQFTLASNLTWDQGASQGFTSQTDTVSVGLTGVWTPHKRFELQLGGSLGVLTGGSLSTAQLANGSANPVGYTATFGDDLVYTLNGKAALHF